MKILGVITNDQSELRAKGQCKRSKVKVTEVKTQHNRFRTQFEFTYDDEMMLKAWCFLGEVAYYFSRPSIKLWGHTAETNRRIWPKLSVSGL